MNAVVHKKYEIAHQTFENYTSCVLLCLSVYCVKVRLAFEKKRVFKKFEKYNYDLQACMCVK